MISCMATLPISTSAVASNRAAIRDVIVLISLSLVEHGAKGPYISTTVGLAPSVGPSTSDFLRSPQIAGQLLCRLAMFDFVLQLNTVGRGSQDTRRKELGSPYETRLGYSHLIDPGVCRDFRPGLRVAKSS
jgi:hypothetical protein